MWVLDPADHYTDPHSTYRRLRVSYDPLSDVRNYRFVQREKFGALREEGVMVKVQTESLHCQGHHNNYAQSY